MNPFSAEIPSGPEQKQEDIEKEQAGPDLEIFLGRHPDKPSKMTVTAEEIAEYKEKNQTGKEVSDDAISHILRHLKGGSPISPEGKPGSVSLKGIYQSHDYVKDVLWGAIKEAPRESVIIDFATSEVERTKESASIMRQEIEAEAKKSGKNIKIMGIQEASELAVRDWNIDYLHNLGEYLDPWLENPPEKEIAPDPHKVAKDVENWVKKVAEFTKTLPKDKKYIVVGISHGGILDAYLKEQTGKLPSQLGGDLRTNEFMQIKGFNKNKPLLSYRGENYNLKI